MPNSLKAKLSKLRYKGQITDAEYQELIHKLDGHDEQLLEDILGDIRMEIKRKSYYPGVYEYEDMCIDLDDVLKIIEEKVKEVRG